LWLKHRFKPWLEKHRYIERWKGALAHNYGMNKFDGHVLRIGRIRAASEGEKTAARKETLCHRAAGFRETACLARKECLHDLIPLQKTLFYFQCQLRSELAGGRHEAVLNKSLLANAWQGISDQHVYNPASPVTRADHDRTGVLLPRLADDLRAPAAGCLMQGIEGSVCLVPRDHGEKLAFIGNVQGIESQQLAGTSHRIVQRNRFFLKHDSQPTVARKFVERSGNSASRRIAHPANPGSSGLCQGFNQWKDGTRVRTKISFKIEFAAR
jgi:hypothetical protein